MLFVNIVNIMFYYGVNNDRKLCLKSRDVTHKTETEKSH